jgi:protein SCO1/2
MKYHIIHLFTFALLSITSCGGKSTINNESTGKDSVNQLKTLPYLGEELEGKKHQIAPFSFINQDNQIITNQTFENQVYVAEFFFTSCPSICPIMHGNLMKVYEKFKTNPGVKILSHTIDPDYDTPAVLKKYATDKNIDTDFWILVTGNKDEIYTICENSYLAFAKKDEKAEGGYIHSGFLTLIDKNGHIRGAYDGTTGSDVDKLISDIQILLNEK